MPFPFPASTLYRWATNTGAARVAPTDAEKVSGFEGGDPVPPLTVNDILGVLSDWVAYAVGSGFGTANQILFYPSSYANPIVGASADVLYIIGGSVDVRNNGGGGQPLWNGVDGPHPFGGQVSSVQAIIASGSVSGTDNIVRLTVTIQGGLEAVYEKTDIDSGDAGTTVTLALASSTLPETGGVVDLTGPFYSSLVIQAGSSSGDDVRVNGIFVNFA